MMSTTKIHRVIFCALFCVAAFIGSTHFILAQDSPSQRTSTREDETNLDLELYMIVATNLQSREGKIPASLDPVMKQLRETLAFKNYSLEATLVNRVKNGGSLNLSWIVGPLLHPSTPNSNTPTFNEFAIGRVRLMEGDGEQVIQMLRFGFGSKIPIQTGTNIGSSGTAAPVFSYEHIGLTTDISVRDGQPAIVGTLNVGPSGEAIVLAILAKRVRK